MDMRIVYAHLESLVATFEANGQPIEAQAVRTAIAYVQARLWWERQIGGTGQ